MPEERGGAQFDAEGVDAAIAQVLQAERDAREAVQRCAREAETIVEDAHERARHVARRAAHRTVRVQRWSAALLQRQLAEVAAQQAQIEQQAEHSAVPARLIEAVQALAALLTGGRR